MDNDVYDPEPQEEGGGVATDLNPGHNPADDHAIGRAGLRSAEGGETSFGDPNSSSKSLNNPGSAKLSGAGTNTSGAAAAGATAGALAGAEAAAGGGFGFNPVDKVNPVLGFLIKNRKSAAGGGIGALITGMIFLGLGVSSGPLQFIHMAELLKQFHAQEQSDMSDDRLGKMSRLYRWAKTGQFEKTRLGYFANNYADSIEKKINGAGLESTYDKNGNFTGYAVDKTNENFKGLSDEQIKSALSDKYGVALKTTPTSDGKLLINTESKGYFSQRKLIGGTLKEAGFKGISGAIKARIMGKRAGISWHVISKLDTKVRNAAFNKVKDIWNEQKDKFKTTVKEGAPAEAAQASTHQETDKNGKPTANNDPASANTAESSANQVSSEASQAATGDPAAKASVKGKLLGAGGLALGGTGLICLIHGLNDGAKAAKEAQVVLPLMRLGTEAVSLGGQMQYGGQDNPDFMQQAGYFSTTFFNSKEEGNVGSWAGSESIQANLGNAKTGVAPDSVLTSITKGSALSFINDIPGVGALCGKAGTIVQLGFSFIAGPISAGLGLIVSHAISAFHLLDPIINMLAGQAVNLDTLAGPMFGNYADYGFKMASDQQFAAAGGGTLTAAQSAQLNANQQQEQTSDFKRQSFAYRVFSPDTPRSLVGSLIDAQNPHIMGNLSQVSSGFVRFGSSLLSIPARLFGSTAHATTGNYDYGLPNVGFSAEEQADPSVQNPYENANYVVSKLLPNSDVRDKINSCFGVSVNEDGSSVQAAGSNITNIYSPDYNGSGCTDGSAAGVSREDWLKVRMFIFDSETADAASCYGGDNESCTNVGFATTDSSGSASGGSDTVSSPGAPSYCGDGSAAGNQKIVCSAWLFDNYGYNDPGIRGGADVMKGLLTSVKACNTNGYKKGQDGCTFTKFQQIVDCSGLMNAAVYDATGIDLGGVATAGMPGHAHLTPIDPSQAQAGDVAWRAGHTEIIVSRDNASGKLNTFGAHQQQGGDKDISPATYGSSEFTKIFRVTP